MNTHPRLGHRLYRRIFAGSVCCWLFVFSVCMVPALGAPPSPAGLRDAFTAEDIDWSNTLETPANSLNRNHPRLSYHDGILRAIGLVNPDGDGIMASWGNGWYPAGKGYCRLAFKKPVAIGTILKGSGWSSNVDVGPVSILRPDAPYPGDLDNDAQWQRLEPLLPSTGVTQFALPPGVTTRAVRVEGEVSAMRFLAGRYTNLAPQAAVVTSGGAPEALQANQAWGVNAKADIDPEHPEWLILSWSGPRDVSGLMLARPVFEQYDVGYFTGAVDADPLGAGESNWKTFPVVNLAKPWRAPNQSYVSFEPSIRTTAIRIRILKGFDQVEGGGDRRLVTLRGISVLSDLGAADVTPSATAAGKTVHPPIAIPFHLDHEGYVTLAIDNAQGRRVRNLIAETHFPAGDNTAWWDGLDESLQLDPGVHGVYTLAGKLISPGTYHVRGLYHNKVELRYETSVYTGGDPSWFTPDGSGGWLADESAPTGVVFLPGVPGVPGASGLGARDRVLVSSPVAESGHGLAWLDLTGKKIYGTRGIGAGGGWCGGNFLARDAGTKPVPGIEAYSLTLFNGQLEIWATGVNRKIYSQPAGDPSVAPTWGGIAARDGLVAVSLTKTNELLFVDAASGKKLDTAPLPDARGLAFDADGRLVAISHDHVVRMDISVSGGRVQVSEPRVLISTGLEDPQQVTLDAQGNIYVSDWGNSHQIKVFTSEGKPLRTIGTAAWAPDEHHDPARMNTPIGGARVGPYDPTRMSQPTEMTISSDNHLWVAESSYVPKRISIWTLDGKLVKAMYGPANYGGAGAIDSKDKSLFFIGANYGTLQYRIDWKTGQSRLESVCWLHGETARDIQSIPQYPLDVHGHRYLTNLYSEGEVGGENVAFFWRFKHGVATPIAAMGNAGGWELLRDEKFRSRWPSGVDYNKDYKSKPLLFAWSDLNHDGQIQPEEVEFMQGGCSSLTIDQEMGLTSTDGWYFPARLQGDVPVYDLIKRVQLIPDGRGVITSGGANGLSGRGGWFVTCSTPNSLPWGYITGAREGKVVWTYPCEAIGLHAGYAANRTPPYPGYMYAITRVLGPTITPHGTDAELWMVNGNFGEVYAMTTDGLFVSTLFRDVRLASPLPTKAVRNESMTDTTLNQEDFLPTITQTRGGNIYVVCQHAQSVIVRVDGLESIRRLPDSDLKVTPGLLADTSAYFVNREAQRLANRPPEVLNVSIREAGPVVDGKLDDWQNVQWAKLDDRAGAAVMIAGDKLYAALRTDAAGALDNNGPAVPTFFKDGGGMDLMIGTDPAADPNRQQPVAGDVRLLVALVKGKPAAFVYRPVTPGAPDNHRVNFTSPVRSITMDEVEDVGASVQIASAPAPGGSGGGYEISIPLEKLGLHPKPGQMIRGDIGILRGDGVETIQRLYWHNKKAGVVSDIPSEAELTPQLWGQWRFLRQ